jgi:hypothetical protein
MLDSQIVESYKFWDVVSFWGRERLVHEVIVARELARGIVRDGLRFQSSNPQWLKSSGELKGYPYIGYTAVQGEKPLILRAETLEHLLGVMRETVDPSKIILTNEYVTKTDFRKWLVRTGQSLPVFWFADTERMVST